MASRLLDKCHWISVLCTKISSSDIAVIIQVGYQSNARLVDQWRNTPHHTMNSCGHIKIATTVAVIKSHLKHFHLLITGNKFALFAMLIYNIQKVSQIIDASSNSPATDTDNLSTNATGSSQLIFQQKSDFCCLLKQLSTRTPQPLLVLHTQDSCLSVTSLLVQWSIKLQQPVPRKINANIMSSTPQIAPLPKPAFPPVPFQMQQKVSTFILLLSYWNPCLV